MYKDIDYDKNSIKHKGKGHHTQIVFTKTVIIIIMKTHLITLQLQSTILREMYLMNCDFYNDKYMVSLFH